MTLRTQITNDIRNGAGASGGGGGGDNAIPQGIHVWIERFTKLKPLAFRSAVTPAEAEDWITHMEKLFQVGGDAFADTCTWVAFREIFYNRYFPASEQQRYERDRENSGEYMERFTRLASFVGATAGDAQRQARHFKWGLKKWVLDRIVNTEYTNVAQVAAVARNIELLHESGNSNKRDRDGHHENRGRLTRVLSIGFGAVQDRGYDSKRQDFRGQDQRFAGRNGNDRQGQGQRRRPRLQTHHYGCHQRLKLSPKAPKDQLRDEVRSFLGLAAITNENLEELKRRIGVCSDIDSSHQVPVFQIITVDASKKFGLCFDATWEGDRLRFKTTEAL
ncbi:hypothetical protein Tco_1568755 [Tanacetum coccineum]